ncbi:hypothetical protein B5E60_00960 [Alistipes sp. An116]|uniref:Ig-like domain-containing protein n=1 Tax=Alistipes sp. An116 TaxID=1965546 RepID=UPI000B3787AC|nr:Ig-like domain-containing protein [Alistipes sp. An116]OUQ54885.1 hypothetical protein B5E60_00960 [Alistipes sp. An116]
MKRILCYFAALVVALGLSSCMEKEDTPPYFVHVESVSFGIEKLSLPETKTYRLQILFTPEDCGNKKVTWYNTEPEVATVSAEGLITAKAEGVTRIGIETSDMRRTAEVEVTVTPFLADNPITSIVLSATSHDFLVTDEPFAVTATITPSDATIPTLEWVSSDEAVARVSQEGLITPVSHGRAVITAKANDGSKQMAECQVTVAGVKDRNYDGADEYYKLIYYPVNIEVTLEDGTKATQTWLDRNLGARKVAESKDDYEAYGSLFQWSRKADGHEKTAWTSATAGVLVNGIAGMNERVPNRADAGHNQFIPTNAAPNDWAVQTSTQETGLWGGKYIDYEWHASLADETQSSNPCPEGYRIPTVNEFLAMGGAILNMTMKYNTKYNLDDPNTIFAESVLHLPSSGHVVYNTATADTKDGNARGVYWANSSAAKAGDNYNNSNRMLFMSGQVIVNPYQRSNAYSVRCIRDVPLETTSLED